MSTEAALVPVTPFTSAEIPDRPWLRRLLRRPEPAYADVALRNLFALRPPSDVPPSEVDEVFQRANLTGRSRWAVARQLISGAARAFAGKDALTERDFRYLSELGRCVGLTDDAVAQVVREEGRVRYRTLVDAAIADGAMTGDVDKRLAVAAAGLRVSDSDRAEVHAAAAAPVCARMVSQIVARGVASPADMQALAIVPTRLGLREVPLDNAQKVDLARAQVLYAIQQGQLPELRVPLALHKGEVCHFHAAALWFEQRSRTVAVGFAGPVASVRVAPGLRYRIGAYHLQRQTTEEMTLISKGSIYITSKRIIFQGDRRSTSISLSGVLAFIPYRDPENDVRGIIVEKANGKPPYFSLFYEPDVGMAVLGEALARLQK